ncbi:hypothetical protein GY12_06185, partial [Micrococcus luteus]
MQTRAPSSMTAAFHALARAGSSGMRAWARRISARVSDLPGRASPATARAITRRTLVSTTVSGMPNAKLATAAAVYSPMPGQGAQGGGVGRHPAVVALD